MIALLKPRSVFIPCIFPILKIHFYPSTCEYNLRTESNIEFANFTNEYMKYVITFIPNEELRIMFYKKKMHFLLSSFINDYLFYEDQIFFYRRSLSLYSFSVITSKVISKVNFLYNITCI